MGRETMITGQHRRQAMGGNLLQSRMLPVFVNRATRMGIAVGDLLARYDLPADAGDAACIEIDCATLRAFVEALALRVGDPAFGFHAALEMPRGAYGVLEYVVRNSPTLREVVEQLAAFSRLINAKLDVTFDHQTGRLEQRIAGEPECLGRQGNDFSLAHQVAVVREAAARRIVPDRVYLAHARVKDDELVRFFGAGPIEYGSGFNGVDLSPETLALPMTSADPGLLHVLEERARTLASELSNGDDLDPVRRVIRLQLQSGEPVAGRVAQELGTSERTLHRRLLARGKHFRDLVDELRRKLAEAYLRDSARSITDVGVELGYSDGRAFARAFRRWTSETPAAWRSRVGEDSRHLDAE